MVIKTGKRKKKYKVEKLKKLKNHNINLIEKSYNKENYNYCV
jgi:hypothetical protein